MKWTRLRAGQYETRTKKYDYYITRNGGRWALDIFDASIKDSDRAHVGVYEYDSMRTAMMDANKEE